MPFGNRKKNILEKLFVQYCHNSKNITPWIPEIEVCRHFPKLETAYFNGKNPFNFS